MIDFTNLPLTPDSARAARNYCGLNQLQAAEESQLPAHKIKRFEAGNYIPDVQFLDDLRTFYEGKGYEFPDQIKPGANAKASGQVFPEGVVSTDDDMPIGRPQKHYVQHVRIDPTLSDDEVGNIFDHIERNEDRVSHLLNKKVEHGFFGLADTAEANHAQAIRLLAENGTLFGKLLGRPLVDAPSDELVKGTKKPQTHAELLAHTQMHMHGAIQGNKEAIAKHKAEKTPQTLTEAVFG